MGGKGRKSEGTHTSGRSEGSLKPGAMRVDLLCGRWVSVQRLTDDWPQVFTGLWEKEVGTSGIEELSSESVKGSGIEGVDTGRLSRGRRRAGEGEGVEESAQEKRQFCSRWADSGSHLFIYICTVRMYIYTCNIPPCSFLLQ